MSRNKDIDYIHYVTGWSYKECRRKYKENGYSLIMTLPGVNDNVKKAIDAATKSIKAVAEAITKVAETLCDTIKSVDWTEAAKQIKEAERDMRWSYFKV